MEQKEEILVTDILNIFHKYIYNMKDCLRKILCAVTGLCSMWPMCLVWNIAKYGVIAYKFISLGSVLRKYYSSWTALLVRCFNYVIVRK